MAEQPHSVSRNGAEIPALGFGTFELKSDDARRMVAKALEIGYRHIDTAQIYRNEAAVGQGIADSGVDRDAVFLTTKVWFDHFGEGDLQRSVDESLERLATDHVDLLLLHWPAGEVPLAETIEALNAVQADGRARHIGISNFTTSLIDKAVALSEAPLVTNQVEYHPFLDQSQVLSALRRHGLSLTAYSPIAQGQVFSNRTLVDIGEEYGENAAQVALRWLLDQDGVIAIPRTTSAEHAASNFDVFDFSLSLEQRKEIDALARPDGRIIDPSFAPDWD